MSALKKLADRKIQWLLIIYLTVALVKIILTLEIQSPFIFDEGSYSEMAQSFIKSGQFLIQDAPSNQYPPFYTVVISIAYFSGDGTVAYPLVKIINSLLSSLIIFPVWLIAREFLSEKKSLIIAVMSSLMPASFAYTFTIVSENVFYPLFIFSLFFMMRSLAEGSRKWDVLCGVSIGLSILTKMTGMVLLVALVSYLLIRGIVRHGRSIIKIIMAVLEKWRTFLVSAAVIAPWLIRNVYYFGFTYEGVMGYPPLTEVGSFASRVTGTKSALSPADFVYWGTMHAAYFILATGIIFFALSIVLAWTAWRQKSWQNKNTNLRAFIAISWISWMVFVLICAYWTYYGGHRYLMGRYIVSILPAFLIMGAMGLNSYENSRHKPLFGALVICSAVLAFIPINYLIRAYSTPDAYMLLVPQQLCEMGILHFMPSATVIKSVLVALPFVFLILAWKNLLKWKYIIPLLLAFFLVGSTLASSVIYVASQDVQDEFAIGLWLHDNAPRRSTVLFDERDKNETLWVQFGAEFWADARIKTGDVNMEADYIVSLHQLNLPVATSVKSKAGVLSSYDATYILYFTNKTARAV
jgi:4-amino-4-deoxy-L-arabinose transferase-like glycosyltransferase